MMERIIDTAVMEYTGEEIIRCRDCKNRAYSEEVCSDECKVTFDHIGTINGRDAYARRLVKPNDTCSWAERDDQ